MAGIKLIERGDKVIRPMTKFRIHCGLLTFLLLGICPISYGATFQSNVAFFPSEEIRQDKGFYWDRVVPGETKSYPFFVQNTSDKEVTVEIYPSDALSDRGGGKAFQNPADEKVTVGSWFETPAQKLQLRPKESRRVDFILRVPANISFGQYIGYIVMLERLEGDQLEQQQNKINLNVTNEARHGIQIVLDFQPEKAVHNLSIVGTTHKYLSEGLAELSVGVQNAGSILEKPKVKVRVINSEDENVFEIEVQADSIYAQTTAQIPFVIHRFLPADTYRVSAEVQHQDVIVTKDSTFTVDKKESMSSLENLLQSGRVEKPKVGLIEIWELIKGTVLFVFALVMASVIALAFLFLKLKSKHKKKPKTD